jgi:hypothetical protein
LEGGFVPALSMLVCSDVHLNAENPERAGRLASLIRQAGELSGGGPDVFLCAGDFTDRGRPEEFSAYFDILRETLPPGATVLSVIAKNHDNWAKGRYGPKTGFAYYRSHTDLPTDFHVKVKGFHFIGISTSTEEDVYYSPYQREWLVKELDAAVADTPDLPVFVTHHEHVTDTVFGSTEEDGWGHDFFRDIFLRYPQVVHFSGHSHYPLNDPRSVWCGAFTAVGAGALSYAELTVDGINKTHPPEHQNIAQGWLVEADASGQMRMRGLDALSGTVLCERRFYKTGGTPRFVPFPPRMQAPRFPEGAGARVYQTETGLEVSFPAAEAGPDDPVFVYRIRMFGAKGPISLESLVLPWYWKSDRPARYTAELSTTGGTGRYPERPSDVRRITEIPASAQKITVIPETALGSRGAALDISL